MTDTIDNQYNNPQIVAGFEALGHGREKGSIGRFAREFITTNYNGAPRETAVILGVGTGWEIDLVSHLGFNKIVGFDPGEGMLNKAKALVQERKYQNVELFDGSHIDEMNKHFAGKADLVIGTHVIPALETRELLIAHFRDYQKFLTDHGRAVAITNNPSDQFHGYDTYSCHYDGKRQKDGMRVRTILNDVKLGAKEITIGGERYTSGGKSLMVVDTFWSEETIRESIREAGVKLTGTILIDLDNENEARNLLNVDQAKVPSEALYSPYVAFILRKTQG